MRDRMGWAASNAAIANAQANASGDTEMQGMMELLARANMLETQENHIQGRGPITGPAEINSDNVFEKAFSDGDSSPASTRAVSYTHLTLPTICSV